MNIMCFGEPLVRLATDAHERLEDANMMEISYSGAEMTVAAALSMQGDEVSYVSKLSDNRLGENVLMTLSRYGVNTSNIILGPGRVGIFYVERGKSIRPTIVTYDRAGSAIALATHDEFDWDHILNGVEMLFFTGIIPAVSDEMRIATRECLQECKGRGIMVAFDMNYRSSMWSVEDAQREYDQILPMVDILTASEDDILLLGKESAVERDDMLNACLGIITKTQKVYSIPTAAFVVRAPDRYDIATFRGVIAENDMVYFSKEQSVAVSDLSSCGSMFSAGIVHAKAKKWDSQFVVDYATIASAYKATIRGDYSLASETEIRDLFESSSFRPRTIQ